MSIEAVSWALSLKVSRSSAKFVLVAMANCADANMLCWPSVAHLSDATCQDRKTVLENVKRLIEGGFIEDSGERKGTTRQVIVYRLKEPENGAVKESQKRNSTGNGTVPKTEGNSPVFPHKQSRFSAETVPKTGHGTVIEPSLDPSGTKKILADAKPEPKKSKRACQLPADFEPDETGRRKAEELGVSVAAELERFRDHHAARGNSMIDWQAAWRTWVRNARDFAQLGRGVQPQKAAATSRHAGFADKDYHAGVNADGSF